MSREMTARDMARKRWAGTTKAQRRKALALVSAFRTSEGAAKAARSISPEAAKARAIKAAATRKRRAATRT